MTVVFHRAVQVARGGARRTRRRAPARRARLVDDPLVVRIEGESPRRRRDEVAVLGTRGRRRLEGALCHAPERSHARGVAFVPAGTDARDRRAFVDRLNARGKSATSDATRAMRDRRSRRRIRRRRTPRIARAGDGRRPVSRTRCLFDCCACFAIGVRSRALRGARSRRRPKRLRAVTRLTHSSHASAIPDAGGSRTPLDSLRRARGSPTPDGRDDVHLQEGCARASGEGGAQGERVRPRPRGGRGRSRHRRDRGQRAVRQVQEKRACRGRPPRARRSNPTRTRDDRSRRRPTNDYDGPFSSVASRRPRVSASPRATRALPPRVRAIARAPRARFGRESALARAATGLGDDAGGRCHHRNRDRSSPSRRVTDRRFRMTFPKIFEPAPPRSASAARITRRCFPSWYSWGSTCPSCFCNEARARRTS